MNHSPRRPTADVVVVGGGIAGVSVAYELATDRDVLLLEMESSLGNHATGRSAAMYLKTYGGTDVRALTAGSRDFLDTPLDGFGEQLLIPLPLLQFAAVGRGHAIDDLHVEVKAQVPSVQLLTASELPEACPLLRPDVAERGLLEPDAMEIDVHALHQGYVRGLRDRGARVRKSSRVDHIERSQEGWRLHAGNEWFEAPLVINAAGAWADRIARLAGCAPVGLQPLRRTAFTMSGDEIAPEIRSRLPLLYDIDETFYIKPEGQQLLCSPADRTRTQPSDAKPDELEIARALDRIHEMTTLGVRSVRTAWAGLRATSPDDNLVIGPDPRVQDFVWCAGQGGYGIQTAPAAARLTASLVRDGTAPTDLSNLGLDTTRVSPERLADQSRTG